MFSKTRRRGMSNTIMEMEVYNAAVKGDLTIFSIKCDEKLLKKTCQKNNIIHVAAQHQQINFIKAALNNFPSIPTCESLLYDQNRHGNTPLHIAAQLGQDDVIDHLYEFFSTKCTNAGGSDRVFPWRMVNSGGNTPAHVALLYGKFSVARYLVEKDDSLARLTNHSKETLLHLAIQFHHVFDNPEMQSTSSSRKVYQPREDLWPIVQLLLKIESSVACWASTDGTTPLHRVASLDPAYCIRAIKAMLASCPEAAEVHDERSEHTILHLLTNHQVASYEQGLELLQIPQVYALIDIKNDQGDTPLHLAARNHDTIMVRVLLESFAELGLKNNSGVSAWSLLPRLEQMRITKKLEESKRKLTKEECEAAKNGNIAFLKEQMDCLGMNFMVSQTPTGGNFFHILFLYNYDLFDSEAKIRELDELIGHAIQMLPSLIIQQDRNGDTVVHILASIPFGKSELLNIVFKYLKKVEKEAGSDARDGIRLSPWKLKNVKGDMPFHVAITAQNYNSALKLLEMDEDVAHYVHNRNQNSLHLISHVHRNGYDRLNEQLQRLINCLVNVNADLPYMQDEDGLTPLLVAVQRRSRTMIEKLAAQFPASLNVADVNGRSLWHYFVYQRLDRNSISADIYSMHETSKFLVEQDYDNIRGLMRSKDNDGNTPLHLAIANRHFDFALFFLENWDHHFVRSYRYDILLSEENKAGKTPYNLIESAEHLPREFEITLFKHGNLLSGYRSMYGVPTTKIEAYANTIGVVAALLATITFTAAFTVPGGVDSSSGTPFLLKRAAFQVFMVADVVAMCTSMMVLFCLLWIMTTGNKADSISLLDVSVFLLQTSFHATLVTFMTGLYVTTISVVPAIAISTLVACTLLIIIMHKRLVMSTVVPLCRTLIIFCRMLRHLPAMWSLLKERLYYRSCWPSSPSLGC